LDVVKHSVANAIFLFNSPSVVTGMNVVWSDLSYSLLLLLLPLDIFYDYNMDRYNAFQQKALEINNSFFIILTGSKDTSPNLDLHSCLQYALLFFYCAKNVGTMAENL